MLQLNAENMSELGRTIYASNESRASRMNEIALCGFAIPLVGACMSVYIVLKSGVKIRAKSLYRI